MLGFEDVKFERENMVIDFVLEEEYVSIHVAVISID